MTNSYNIFQNETMSVLWDSWCHSPTIKSIGPMRETSGIASDQDAQVQIRPVVLELESTKKVFGHSCDFLFLFLYI